MLETTFYILSAIVSIMSLIVTTSGAIFAGAQLWQIKENRKIQFEQDRRMKTVDMITNYIGTITKETKATEKIVSKLNDEQCQNLYNCTSFEVEDKLKKQICEICPYKERCNELGEKEDKPCKSERANEITIQGELLYFIRNSVINRLNNLECIMLAWQIGVVEKDVIEEQFAFLNKKREKERALEAFRSIAGGGKAYPAIEKFYLKLDAKRHAGALETFKDELE